MITSYVAIDSVSYQFAICRITLVRITSARIDCSPTHVRPHAEAEQVNRHMVQTIGIKICIRGDVGGAIHLEGRLVEQRKFLVPHLPGKAPGCHVLRTVREE